MNVLDRFGRSVKRSKALVAIAGFLWLTVTPAIAGGIYDFTSAPVSHDSSDLSLGFVFTTNLPLTVTSLGYFDDGGNGFAVAHTVGIFDDNGYLLTSTTLSAGTGDPLDGQFRYQAIAPITLAAGNSYTLAATTGGPDDAWAYGIVGSQLLGLAVDPSITITRYASRFSSQDDNGLQDPPYFYKYTLYAGPNLNGTYAGPNLNGTVVPEPGTLPLVLVGVGLAVAGLARRRIAQ
jgi:hypothetical protein